MKTKIDFTKFYIVRRFDTKSGQRGESLNVVSQVGNIATAYSNLATVNYELSISIPRLIDGILRGDYRLVMKSE